MDSLLSLLIFLLVIAASAYNTWREQQKIRRGQQDQPDELETEPWATELLEEEAEEETPSPWGLPGGEHKPWRPGELHEPRWSPTPVEIPREPAIPVGLPDAGTTRDIPLYQPPRQQAPLQALVWPEQEPVSVPFTAAVPRRRRKKRRPLVFSDNPVVNGVIFAVVLDRAGGRRVGALRIRP